MIVILAAGIYFIIFGCLHIAHYFELRKSGSAIGTVRYYLDRTNMFRYISRLVVFRGKKITESAHNWIYSGSFLIILGIILVVAALFGN